MTALAIFAATLATGTYWGITLAERGRAIDADIRRFLDQLDQRGN